MPVVRTEIFPGRTAEKKLEIGREIPRVLEGLTGAAPAAAAVVLTDVSPSDRVVAGAALGPPGVAPST